MSRKPYRPVARHGRSVNNQPNARAQPQHRWQGAQRNTPRPRFTANGQVQGNNPRLAATNSNHTHLGPRRNYTSNANAPPTGQGPTLSVNYKSKEVNLQDLNPEAKRIITKPVRTENALWNSFQSMLMLVFQTADLSGNFMGSGEKVVSSTYFRNADADTRAEIRDALMLILAELNLKLKHDLYGASLSNDPTTNLIDLDNCDLAWLPISFSAPDASAELIDFVKSKLIEYPGTTGPEYEKLYLHFILARAKKRITALSMGTSGGRGTTKLPLEVKNLAIRVIGPNDDEFVGAKNGGSFDQRPPVRLRGRDVPANMYIILLPMLA